MNKTIPMGVIQATPQGFNLEQYVPGSLVLKCHNETFVKNIKSFIFKDMYWGLFVEPFMNHTVKGVLWYQGMLFGHC